jgi:membrane associated rhomboid family serine protease
MNLNVLRKPFRYSYTNMTLKLILINGAVFLLTYFSRNLLIYLSMVPGLVVQEGFVWQFFTYMFVHANFSHILFNMLGLFFFGTQVEQRMGSREFLLFYLLTGFLAGLFSFFFYILTGSYGVILLGASGAVYAVLLAFAAYYPHARIFLFGIIPIQAPLLVALYTAIAVFGQLGSLSSGVAHLTHLAGFVFSFLYLLIRLGINPIDQWKSSGRGPWR